MTDDEILFDYMTVAGRQRDLSEQVLDEDQDEAGPVQLPEFEQVGDMNKGRSLRFSADEAAFREWLAREGGV